MWKPKINICLANLPEINCKCSFHLFSECGIQSWLTSIKEEWSIVEVVKHFFPFNFSYEPPLLWENPLPQFLSRCNFLCAKTWTSLERLKVVGWDICELLDFGKEMVFYRSVHDSPKTSTWLLFSFLSPLELDLVFFCRLSCEHFKVLDIASLDIQIGIWSYI